MAEAATVECSSTTAADYPSYNTRAAYITKAITLVMAWSYSIHISPDDGYKTAYSYSIHLRPDDGYKTASSYTPDSYNCLSHMLL